MATKFCSKCETDLDHVVPVAYGGTHTYDNATTSCAECNLSKGARRVLTCRSQR